MSFKKKVNIAFVLIFIIMSVSVCLFNYIVDPYGLKYMSSNNFNLFHIPRNLVYSYINKTKNIKFDSVVIGGSSTGMIFHPSLFYRDTKENLAALQTEGLLPDEMYNMLEYFLNIHPEIKKAYISLELLQYISCSSQKTIPEKPTSFVQDFISLYFSIGATSSSIEKIKSNFSKTEENSDIVFRVNKKLKWKYDICEYDNYPYIKKINELLKERKIEAKYFVLPVNSVFLSELYKKGQFGSLENFKREITKISSFYDMAFINEYTKDPFKWLWRDPLHMSQMLCPYIYETLVYDINHPEFVQIVGSKNIEKTLINQRRLVERYMMENKEYVDEYINYHFDATKYNQYNDYRYWKDMPEPYKTRFFTEYDEYYKDREKGKI